ncbi:MAG: hypothetical protein H7Y03_05880 [Chitinophagaceae bacterium]|nr:hypothetical protein [Chitinophagaceae bacterium]
MKKTIAIIGADDKMGTAVAKELVTGPYHLLLLGSNVTCLGQLLNELQMIFPGTDAEVLHCFVDASWEADIIILATAFAVEDSLIARIREVATGKTVIVLVNDDEELAIGQLTERLSYSKVIRAVSAPLKEAPYIPVIDGKPVRVFIEMIDEY